MNFSVEASLNAYPDPRSTERFGYSIETIRFAEKAVHDLLDANGIDEDSVLFSGYNKAQSKLSDNEHTAEDGTPLYHFGDAPSLTPPDQFAGDDEEQEDSWMVNPLRYALEGGTLGVYTKSALDELSGDRQAEFTDVEYGTYVYALTPEKVAAAQLIELTIPRAVDRNAR